MPINPNFAANEEEINYWFIFSCLGASFTACLAGAAFSLMALPALIFAPAPVCILIYEGLGLLIAVSLIPLYFVCSSLNLFASCAPAAYAPNLVYGYSLFNPAPVNYAREDNQGSFAPVNNR